MPCLENEKLSSDLHDEKTNKRLLFKGTGLDRAALEKLSARNLKRAKVGRKDPTLFEKIDDIEEMTSRQIDILRKITMKRFRS